MTTIETPATQPTAKALHEARQDLDALQRDLPDLQEKVSALHREVAILKEARDFEQAASLEGQRVAYQELLQSHHSEIATAKQEVARLEALHAHEQHLNRLTELAETAASEYEDLRQKLEAAGKHLAEALEEALAPLDALTQARNRFGLADGEEHATELERRGVDVAAALAKDGAPLDPHARTVLMLLQNMYGARQRQAFNDERREREQARREREALKRDPNADRPIAQSGRS